MGRHIPREQWGLRIDAWKASGLSANEFAEQDNLGESTLHSWNTKFRRERQRGNRKAPVVANETKFIELKPEPPAQTNEIQRGELSLKIPTSCSKDTLKALLALVRELG